MSKRRAAKRSYCELTDEESDSNENKQHIFIPNPDDSGTDGDCSSDTDNSESELSDEDNSESEIHVPNVSYRSVFESYTEKQKLLEPNHTFSWCEGEKVYSVDLKDQLLLPDSVKQKISSMSHVELTNIKQFGYFSTALSIDEMMIRFFGRTCLRQYLPSKPDRYGIKLWALCGANGYIFNVDIYCGKNDTSIGINLSACPLGSRVVLQMVNPLLHSFSKRKLSDYHVYFDNYFTSPDLVVHLNKCGLQSTGTVRKDRVKQKHDFEKKAPRGTNKATGVTPLEPMERYSRTAKKRSKLEFPCAFPSYNKYMGGVDLHDFRCKKASPSVSSKKWPFKIFSRIIEMSITNAVTISNLCRKDRKIMKTQEMCKEARY
ncbi:piggyBac transposable element-derived protein 3-like [Phymastichus coffea]|uniref:piggyBac transposable element-derived protein 3-like n=1 Tax=Phymastichus coffea TaxID=108790 RepID=UPI00273C8497|nr:piggyBac transposable element-derived protein 3-like [Phymastichus coffea]